MEMGKTFHLKKNVEDDDEPAEKRGMLGKAKSDWYTSERAHKYTTTKTTKTIIMITIIIIIIMIIIIIIIIIHWTKVKRSRVAVIYVNRNRWAKWEKMPETF